MAAVESSTADQTSLFEQLDAYPWSEDNEFQGGLSAILGSVQNPEQVDHLTLRAKCYYYARKAGTTVDFDGYKQWVESHRDRSVNGSGLTNAAAPAESGTGAGGITEAPKPASFAQIVELITEGKPIPGIKDIPDTILDGQSSTSQAERRKKPWEKEAATEDTPSWMTA